MKRFSRLALPLSLGIVVLSSYIPPQDRRYVDYFLKLQSAELFRTRSFLLNSSWAYVSQKKLEKVDMRFSYYRVMDINQTRKMLVQVAEELVDKINSDSTLHEKKLLPEPFRLDQLRLEIRMDNVVSENMDTPAIKRVRLDSGIITYETSRDSTLLFGQSNTYKETFQYALMLLDEPTEFEPTEVMGSQSSDGDSSHKKESWKGFSLPSEIVKKLKGTSSEDEEELQESSSNAPVRVVYPPDEADLLRVNEERGSDRQPKRVTVQEINSYSERKNPPSNAKERLAQQNDLITELEEAICSVFPGLITPPSSPKSKPQDELFKMEYLGTPPSACEQKSIRDHWAQDVALGEYDDNISARRAAIDPPAGSSLYERNEAFFDAPVVSQDTRTRDIWESRSSIGDTAANAAMGGKSALAFNANDLGSVSHSTPSSSSISLEKSTALDTGHFGQNASTQRPDDTNRTIALSENMLIGARSSAPVSMIWSSLEKNAVAEASPQALLPHKELFQEAGFNGDSAGGETLSTRLNESFSALNNADNPTKAILSWSAADLEPSHGVTAAYIPRGMQSISSSNDLDAVQRNGRIHKQIIACDRMEDQLPHNLEGISGSQAIHDKLRSFAIKSGFDLLTPSIASEGDSQPQDLLQTDLIAEADEDVTDASLYEKGISPEEEPADRDLENADPLSDSYTAVQSILQEKGQKVASNSSSFQEDEELNILEENETQEKAPLSVDEKPLSAVTSLSKDNDLSATAQSDQESSQEHIQEEPQSDDSLIIEERVLEEQSEEASTPATEDRTSQASGSWFSSWFGKSPENTVSQHNQEEAQSQEIDTDELQLDEPSIGEERVPEEQVEEEASIPVEEAQSDQTSRSWLSSWFGGSRENTVSQRDQEEAQGQAQEHVQEEILLNDSQTVEEQTLEEQFEVEASAPTGEEAQPAETSGSWFSSWFGKSPESIAPQSDQEDLQAQKLAPDEPQSDELSTGEERVLEEQVEEEASIPVEEAQSDQTSRSWLSSWFGGSRENTISQRDQEEAQGQAQEHVQEEILLNDSQTVEEQTLEEQFEVEASAPTGEEAQPAETSGSWFSSWFERSSPKDDAQAESKEKAASSGDMPEHNETENAEEPTPKEIIKEMVETDVDDDVHLPSEHDPDQKEYLDKNSMELQEDAGDSLSDQGKVREEDLDTMPENANSLFSWNFSPKGAQLLNKSDVMASADSEGAKELDPSQEGSAEEDSAYFVDEDPQGSRFGWLSSLFSSSKSSSSIIAYGEGEPEHNQAPSSMPQQGSQDEEMEEEGDQHKEKQELLESSEYEDDQQREARGGASWASSALGWLWSSTPNENASEESDPSQEAIFIEVTQPESVPEKQSDLAVEKDPSAFETYDEQAQEEEYDQKLF